MMQWRAGCLLKGLGICGFIGAKRLMPIALARRRSAAGVSTKQKEQLFIIAMRTCLCGEIDTAKGRNAILANGKCQCGAAELRPLPKRPEVEPFQYGGDMIDVF